MKTSNKFTLARVCFAPIFFFLYFIPIWTQNESLAKVSACIMIPLLALAQITDYFDGHYARKNGEVSNFGKLFDPFADVMLNLTLFVCAQHSFNSQLNPAGYMPTVCFVLILYREFTMNFIRMVAVSRGTAIAARKGGKLKTVFYIASGFFMLAVESLLRFDSKIDISSYIATLHAVAYVMFSICVLLSYISFVDYIRAFAGLLKQEK